MTDLKVCFDCGKKDVTFKLGMESPESDYLCLNHALERIDNFLKGKIKIHNQDNMNETDYKFTKVFLKDYEIILKGLVENQIIDPNNEGYEEMFKFEELIDVFSWYKTNSIALAVQSNNDFLSIIDSIQIGGYITLNHPEIVKIILNNYIKHKDNILYGEDEVNYPIQKDLDYIYSKIKEELKKYKKDR